MSEFYASIDGQSKTEATRRGSPTSGISGHIRGWSVGVRVEGRMDGEDNVFSVYLTSGSNGGESDRLIGQARLKDGVPCFEH